MVPDPAQYGRPSPTPFIFTLKAADNLQKGGSMFWRSLFVVRSKRSTVAIGVCLFAGNSAAAGGYGFCMAPIAPFVYAVKPSKPYCASSRSCSQWEIDNYKRRVESYFNDLQQYMADADKFRKLAYEYAECMADLD
jgi:hypothetical protein